MVKVQCEIKDYTHMKVDNPNVIIKSAWPDDDDIHYNRGQDGQTARPRIIKRYCALYTYGE